MKQLSAVIKGVGSTGAGYRLSLGDGSEWQVTNSSLGRAPAAGDTIEIETGVLSGYRGAIKGKPGLLRMRRLR